MSGAVPEASPESMCGIGVQGRWPTGAGLPLVRGGRAWGWGSAQAFCHPFRCSLAPGPVIAHTLLRDLGFGVYYGSSETK